VFWRGEAADSAAKLNIDAWGGTLLRYQNQLEEQPLGRLCARRQGTGINALHGDLNHAGDNGGSKSCSDFVVVNDSVAPEAR
jgi:hypothetical protein